MLLACTTKSGIVCGPLEMNVEAVHELFKLSFLDNRQAD